MLSQPGVGVVMPVLRIHIVWARLFYESLRWCRADSFAWFPIFPSRADVKNFNHTWRAQLTTRTAEGGLTFLVTPLVVVPDEANPPTSLKWRALRVVFTRYALRYAFTLDPETAFISTASHAHTASLLRNWSARRVVLGSSWRPRTAGGYFARRPPVQLNLTNASCHALGLTQDEARVLQTAARTYIAWSDAPLYERDDFDAFWTRVSQHGLRRLTREVHDSATYMCFKLLTRQWQLVNVDKETGCPGIKWCNAVEYATLAEQREIVRRRDYRFMWLRASPNAFRAGRAQPDRLFTYHLEHLGDTTDEGHWDNFEGFAGLWRKRYAHPFLLPRFLFSAV
ncbi:hypothetical protein AB1Y20_020053 [Prymnesium parvum]|uniref:Uncharacterized protein n=1 Tax=Prymnesium parvum TaxID=97485 RepID=A0AB34JSK4_PRYPA